MNCYRKTELADIHFIYGLAKGNGHTAVRLYEERYSMIWQPNHQTFSRVYQNLVELGSFSTTKVPGGREQHEEGMLHAANQNSGTSVRSLVVANGRNQTTVHHVLQGKALHTLHL
ncbi:hypothetical protein TNCV_2363181 [Trichonephila clavipes]|nr:hypothetical protein TNCV_2363181 [Trichonephila clavipes]